jgi:hypothetical protein
MEPHAPIWQPPKTAAGRLLAAQVWDRLVAVYKEPVSDSLRDAFVAELNAGEAETDGKAGPLAEDLAGALEGTA